MRALSDGSVLLNTYGCSLHLLTGIGAASPRVAHVYTFDAAEPADAKGYRGACAVPLMVDKKFWLMPVGRENRLVTLDISEKERPREVARLELPKDFSPHWLARDGSSNRLVLRAHEGGQQGISILVLDPKTGRVRLDPSVTSVGGRVGTST